MDGKDKECLNGKTNSVLKRRSSTKNPRQRRKNSLKNRVLGRMRREFCKVLRKRHVQSEDSQEAVHDTDDCCGGPSPAMPEDEVDGLVSDDDDSNESDNCFYGLGISWEYLGRRCVGETDIEDTNKENEQVQYEAKMKHFCRLSYPFAVAVEIEYKQAMCLYGGRWTHGPVRVRSSTAQLHWVVDYFGEFSPIEVSGRGVPIKTRLYEKLGDNIVVFGVQEQENSKILYVSAIEKGPGALVLRDGSDPSSVEADNFKSDLRFFHRIYDRRSDGMILQPAFNRNLHLSITQNKLSLAETRTNDFLHWELKFIGTPFD